MDKPIKEDKMNKGNFGGIGPLNDEQIWVHLPIKMRSTQDEKNHDFSMIFRQNLDLVVIEAKHHGEISI